MDEYEQLRIDFLRAIDTFKDGYQKGFCDGVDTIIGLLNDEKKEKLFKGSWED